MNDINNNELDMETLLTLELHTDKGDLIEVILSDMRIHTNLFQAELNKQKKDLKKKLIDKSDELNQAVQFNFDDITQIETELKHIDDENLQ